MKSLRSLILVPTLSILTIACGGTDTKSATKEERTKATILKLLELAKSGDAKAAAPLVVYRGGDKTRKWKDVINPNNEDELKRLKMNLGELKELAGDATPAFVEFTTNKESEGQWLVWKTKIDGKDIMFACLEINGQIALADLDT